ncbi:MAG: glycine--tRNA ligase [Nanoarchaeota archaeon]|nr:glycine--tRNA ligase [Nanoarchaeota archaeon]
MKLNIEEIATFCKAKGFVYPSSDIYGGISGFWDFGPLGVELFNNIKSHWWKQFVTSKENMVGIDASIISHSKIWKASGHLENFGDLVLTCSKCKERQRADHFIEAATGKNVEGFSVEQINEIIKEGNLKCPKCKGEFDELKDFNLLFQTSIGADENKKSTAYLRGETAQGMFTNFKLITETTRQKLPFGIAQIGKCFRNEISPRDFMFRSREFSIAEFEFFIHPEEKKCNLLTKKHLDLKVMLLDNETQEQGKKDLKEVTIDEMIKNKHLGEWHGYWLAEQMMWFYSLGLKKEHLKIREHTKTELSHYSSATFDIDYEFPFGSKEIAGNANRGQYDLKQHIKESKQKLEVYDEATKTKIVPRVIEPTFGAERAFLAVLVNAYENDKERGNIVLKIIPNLAPIKLGIFPLVNKLKKETKELFDNLKMIFPSQFDTSGSIGRRYARADEIGIPYCITYDFDSKDDKSITLRDRDSTKQIRIKIKDIKNTIYQLIMGDIKFEKAGEDIENN